MDSGRSPIRNSCRSNAVVSRIIVLDGISMASSVGGCRKRDK